MICKIFRVAEDGIQESVTAELAEASSANITTTASNYQTAGLFTIQVAGLNNGEPIELAIDQDIAAALNLLDGDSSNFSVVLKDAQGEEVTNLSSLGADDEVVLEVTDAAGREIQSADLRAPAAGELVITISDEDAATVTGTNLEVGVVELDTSSINFDQVTDGETLATELQGLGAIESATYADGELTITTAEGEAITINGDSALVAPAPIQASVDLSAEGAGDSAPVEDVVAHTADVEFGELGVVAENDTLSITIGGVEYVSDADAQGDFGDFMFDDNGTPTAAAEGMFDVVTAGDPAETTVTVTMDEAFTVTAAESEVASRAEETAGVGIDGVPSFGESASILAEGDVVIENGSEAVEAQDWSAAFDIAHLDEGENYEFTLTLTEVLGDDAEEGAEAASFDLSFTVADYADNESVRDALQAVISEQTAPFEVDLNDEGQLVVTANEEGVNYEVADTIGVQQVDEIVG